MDELSEVEVYNACILSQHATYLRFFCVPSVYGRTNTNSSY